MAKARETAPTERVASIPNVRVFASESLVGAREARTRGRIELWDVSRTSENRRGSDDTDSGAALDLLFLGGPPPTVSVPTTLEAYTDAPLVVAVSKRPRGYNLRMRLHKFIANCGYTSRRRAELLIQAGRVTVNGKVLTSLGTTIDPRQDTVAVNGDELSLPTPLTVMLNKPAGLITSTHDTHERLTVMDILPRRLRDQGVLPAGRLDQDTEGLLLLTNDGDLAHRITHPRYETEKEYDALVCGAPSASSLRKIETGVRIEGELTAPARVLSALTEGDNTRVSLVIHEGKKRQVRRMFETVGHRVLHLRRVRIAGLSLGDLPVGEWRELDPKDLAALEALADGTSRRRTSRERRRERRAHRSP
jgi:pseudouridine synthase